jgi:hypothetical protein
MTITTVATGDGFTELDAARLYVRLVNDLDAEPFLVRLDPAVKYSSQWVMAELDTSEAVAQLLRTKIREVQASGSVNTARIGVATRPSDAGLPLVILLEGEHAEATVSFKVADGRITAISICTLAVFKPALLDDPDNYVYTPRPAPAPIKAKPQAKPEPDPDAIIATFADVSENLRAPLADATISTCPKREWGPLEVMLVPPDHVSLQQLNHPELGEVLEEARRGELFLFAIFRPKKEGLIGLSTMERPSQPWASLSAVSRKWYMQQSKWPWEFGIDFDVACEMGIFCMSGLIGKLAPIVARPRPSMALAVLRERYDAIVATAIEIDHHDLSTWPRFLEKGHSTAWDAAHNNVLARLSPEISDRRIVELALEAWPQK